MDRADMTRELNRAYQVEPPVPAVVVPERDLAELTAAARELAAWPDGGVDLEGGLTILDALSEPFADMLDLPHDAASQRLRELRASRDHVAAWLDAGCITLPPVHHIRALVESL
jgi:hypothetical protein